MVKVINELWLIWKNPITKISYKVGVHHKENKYTFSYANSELEGAKKGFKYFSEFPELEKNYESDKIFPNILTRLPNKKVRLSWNFKLL